MPDRLEFQRQEDSGGVRLRLEGELDLASAPQLEQELREIAAMQPERILLDLADLDFMDCTGISLMMRAQRAADANGHTLAFSRVPFQVRRLLSLTGVIDCFTLVS